MPTHRPMPSNRANRSTRTSRPLVPFLPAATAAAAGALLAVTPAFLPSSIGYGTALTRVLLLCDMAIAAALVATAALAIRAAVPVLRVVRVTERQPATPSPVVGTIRRATAPSRPAA